MKSNRAKQFAVSLTTAVALAAALVTGCGGGDDEAAPVTITDAGANPVSSWNAIATDTINVAATPGTGSAAEQRPSSSQDLAAVHIAMYDAVVAITGGFTPYAIRPVAPASGASPEAAAIAAAYGVLKILYPNRGAVYQGAYDSAVAALPAGDATTNGLAIGAEVAAKLMALRGDDGRSVVLATYVPGTAPGDFRGLNPINRYFPSMKPFALTSVSQFRAAPPVALDSAAYATDFEETRTLGGTTSTTRTAAQLEVARFHTEAPPRLWPRNLRRFMTTGESLAEHAHLGALVVTAQADAEIACFESKYFYQRWRPTSAINLADTDGNPATTADPSWTPVVPTPNHPEYPAAHGCVSSAIATALQAHYNTGQITFTMDSTVTNTTHTFTSTQALIDEITTARVVGGMHFRSSVTAGVTLGANVAQWVAQRHFQRLAPAAPTAVPLRPSDTSR